MIVLISGCYNKVIMAIEKPMKFAVEKTCLARHNKKSGSLIVKLVSTLLNIPPN